LEWKWFNLKGGSDGVRILVHKGAKLKDKVKKMIKNIKEYN
jgi:hypothetical protein